MISDVDWLCILTAELTQSCTQGMCIRGYAYLRHNQVLVGINHLKLVSELTLRNADSSASGHDPRLAEYTRLPSLRSRHAGSANAA